jgi:hypothetical protein
MDMHTETALRLPAWTIAALAAVGVALGLWQIGVFDRSSNGGRGKGALASTGQLRTVAAAPSAEAATAASASTTGRANGPEAERPMDSPDRLPGDMDPDVLEESNALQAALAAEQSSN